MAEENIILNIRLNDKEIEQATKAAAEARAEVDRLRKANRELAKAEGDNSLQIQKNNLEIKKYSGTLRDNERVLVANEKATRASGGSIDQLRSQLSIVSQQWAKLSEEERTNTEAGKALSKQKLDLTEKLKAEEKATGDTRRNVGNYAEGVKEALQQTGMFGGVIGTLTQAQMVYTTTMKGATIATSSFKKALISTGIGAIVVALGSLIAFLTRTQEGLDFVSRGFAAVKTFVDTFIDALSDLGKSIIQQIVPTLKGLGQIIKGIVTLNIKDMKEGFDAVKNSVSQIDGINIIEVGKAAANAAKEAARLKGVMQELVKEEADLAVEIAKSRTEILRRKQASQDENLTLKEREELLRSAIQLEQEQINKALELKRERLDALIAEKSLTNSLETDKQEIRDLEVEVAKLEEESLNKQIELQAQLRGIESKREAERKARLAEEQAALDAIAAAELEAAKARAKQEEDLQKLAEERELLRIEQEKTRLAEERAEGLISKQEYEDSLLQIELDNLTKTREAAELARQEAIESTELTELEKQRIILESEKIIADARKKTAQISIDAQKETTEVVEETEEVKKEASVGTAKEIAQLTEGLASENTATAKAAGIAQVGISTQTAATSALAPPPVGAGPILGIPIAALTVAKGIASAAKIAGIGFADGGYTGQGYGSPDESGYRQAGVVHEGEYVVKKSMVNNPTIAPIVSQLEGMRLKGYADGGFVGRTASQGTLNGFDIESLRQAIQNIPNPIVEVSAINQAAQQRNKVRVESSLG